MSTRTKADLIPVGSTVIKNNGQDLGSSYVLDVRGEALQVEVESSGTAKMSVPAGAAHALAIVEFTVAPDGLGGTTFTSAMVAQGRIEGEGYCNVVVSGAYDHCSDDALVLPNSRRVDLVTMHVDPAVNLLDPFIPVAVSFGAGNEIGVLVNAGALPPASAVTIEAHIRVDAIPEV